YNPNPIPHTGVEIRFEGLSSAFNCIVLSSQPLPPAVPEQIDVRVNFTEGNVEVLTADAPFPKQVIKRSGTLVRRSCSHSGRLMLPLGNSGPLQSGFTSLRYVIDTNWDGTSVPEVNVSAGKTELSVLPPGALRLFLGGLFDFNGGSVYAA